MKKRKTIGLLINDIDANYSNYVWTEIKRAAEKNDCNLIIYEGRSIKSFISADNQHHISYSLIDKERLDGIIVMSALISCYIPDKEFIDLCQWLRGIPLISIGVVLPFATSVIIDNKSGMKDLVNHLIKEHKYKRIIFIAGPKTNTDSIERLEAYREALGENNIKIDEKLIFNGDFLADSGYGIMNKIMQDGILYDAVVCANDEMAFGVIKCLKDLKVDMDKGGRVCGFDDCDISGRMRPALTTVRQPIREMCLCAIENILNKIENGETDDIITLPSVLVKRESCGCKNDVSLDVLRENNVRLVPGHRIHENIQTYSLEELFDCVTTVLKLCNIKGCFMSRYCGDTLYYDDEHVFGDKFFIPQYSELVYAFDNYKRLEIDDGVKIFETKSLIPDAVLSKDKRHTYLVNPLFFKNEHFGFVCFEVINDDVLNFEPIRGQISNTLKGALLIEERAKMEERFREIERLASLGQLIGGLSHNLMTPIMSISGACFGLEDLVKEYRESVGDSSVTNEDHNDIADDMMLWIRKLREYNTYMSSAISGLKSQTVQLNSDSIDEFSAGEFIDRIKFIKNNDQRFRKCKLSFSVDIDKRTIIRGDISNLVQITKNLLDNAAESYGDMEDSNKIIELFICREDRDMKLMVRDYGKGIEQQIKNKLFRLMVTTKGKNGAGLSMLLSYSTIRGKFDGRIWFESEKNYGTTFFITVPIFRVIA